MTFSDTWSASRPSTQRALHNQQVLLTAPRWSCDELLEKAQQVYPRETPEPEGLLAGTQLRPYQKQSIAFMLDVERSTEHKGAAMVYHKGVGQPSSVRGGWLADEVRERWSSNLTPASVMPPSLHAAHLTTASVMPPPLHAAHLKAATPHQPHAIFATAASTCMIA